MMRRCLLLTLVVFGLAWSQNPATLPGDPLPGITAFEFERFLRGLEDFTEVETPQDGLGPAFNGTSCAVCHSVPAVGGISSITEVRAGRRNEEGAFEELNGGTLFHLFSTPPHTCQVQIPPEANVIARRMPVPLFGAGLVEAIPDEAIVAGEDPEDLNGDGISGRAARIEDVATGRERIGRFGWKAQQATLLAFSADAYRNEMGITNALFPEEFAAGLSPEQLRLCSLTRGVEDIADRRTRLRGIDNFEAFMKFLAPLERAAASDDAATGEVIFQQTGCAACHTPVFTTGPNANPLFDRRPVALYSDLLLHDVGTGDGIVQAAAQANEIRTPALWGLRFRRPLLHDGSAATVEEAIRRHGGEASAVIERFGALEAPEQRQLLAFLGSL
jgi:CxxC motif-containing protein (DUF1111 family)